MKTTILWSNLLIVTFNAVVCHGLVIRPEGNPTSRRAALEWLVQATTTTTTTASSFAGMTLLSPQPAWAVFGSDEGSGGGGKSVRQERLEDTLDIDSYLKRGFATNPMGVSGQAGKTRPETGVILRDGSEAAQDGNGNVVAEILLQNPNGQTLPFLASFASPWPLATGTVFDVECRDGKSGDSAFLAVTSRVGGKDLTEIPDSFYVNQLFARTGRFSAYGEPTDVKIKRALTRDTDGYRILDVAFSILSQATQTEIPHLARVAVTVPNGADQAVMLVSSSLVSRWKGKKTSDAVRSSVDSFQAIPAPQSSLRLRGKPRRNA